MEFSTNQEDIYSKLVNKSKYGKAVQVKYELTRPRKKQKKKDEPKLEIVQQEPCNDNEEVYCVPPDEEIDDEDEDSEEDESLDPPAPPPRSDSLLPEPNTAAAATSVSNSSCDPALLPAAAVSSESSSSNTIPTVNKDEDNIYAPCNWRQQNYESWTPFFNPSVKDNIPPPTQPPPKPPTNDNQSSSRLPSSLDPPKYASVHKKPAQPPKLFNEVQIEQNQRRRQKDYETWPLNKDPPPPTQPPPAPPSENGPKKGFISTSTPKQIIGLKKNGIGQPTPFTACDVNQGSLLKPSRPAPKPPSVNTTRNDTAKQENTPVPNTYIEVPLEPVENSDIRLSPIKDSLPSPSPTPSTRTEDRLYEPCNWRRQLKDEEEDVYGAMEDFLPPPPSPEPLGGSVTFARAPIRKSKSILKEKKPVEGEEKKKKVRMLFPVDTVTPL